MKGSNILVYIRYFMSPLFFLSICFPVYANLDRYLDEVEVCKKWSGDAPIRACGKSFDGAGGGWVVSIFIDGNSFDIVSDGHFEVESPDFSTMKMQYFHNSDFLISFDFGLVKMCKKRGGEFSSLSSKVHFSFDRKGWVSRSVIPNCTGKRIPTLFSEQ